MCDHHQQLNITHSESEEKADSLFIGIMGSPFNNDLVTNVFRLSEAVLRSGKQLVIWTCGYATQITQTTNVRPHDPIHPAEAGADRNYSLTEIAQGLIKNYPSQLRWYVCRYCMEERGATSQIPEVEILLPFSFDSYLNQADQSLVLGVK